MACLVVLLLGLALLRGPSVCGLRRVVLRLLASLHHLVTALGVIGG